MTEFQAYIILDGLILVDFDTNSCKIIIPNTHGHAHQITTDANATVAGRQTIPAGRDYQVTGLVTPAAGSPFAQDFDVKHLIFDKAKLNVSVPTRGSNPYAVISIPCLPDAIFGFRRFETSRARLLNQTTPNILRGGDRDRVMFTERVVFAFAQAGPVRLTSATVEHAAVAVNGKQVLTLISKPSAPHPGPHAQALNQLLALRTGGNANLGLTGIPFPHPDVTQQDDDTTPALLGLPNDTVQFAQTIETSGCGFTGTRG